MEQNQLSAESYELVVKGKDGPLESLAIPGFTIPVRAIFDDAENRAALQAKRFCSLKTQFLGRGLVVVNLFSIPGAFFPDYGCLWSRRSDDVPHCVGVFGGNLQQNSGRAAWRSAALLPIVKGFDADAKQRGEFWLGEFKVFSNTRYIWRCNFNSSGSFFLST